VTTVYISIGNSDDKLTQLEWAQFVDEVDRAVSAAVKYEGNQVHGRWYSLPTEPWQNACWCVQFHDELAHVMRDLRQGLAVIARWHRQDSITWAVAETEFIGPTS
jgi:hypothetical protein